MGPEDVGWASPDAGVGPSGHRGGPWGLRWAPPDAVVGFRPQCQACPLRAGGAAFILRALLRHFSSVGGLWSPPVPRKRLPQAEHPGRRLGSRRLPHGAPPPARLLFRCGVILPSVSYLPRKKYFVWKSLLFATSPSSRTDVSFCTLTVFEAYYTYAFI